MDPASAKHVIDTLERLCLQGLEKDAKLSRDDARKRLCAELDYYRRRDLADLTINQVFKQFATSLSNRQSLFALIFGGDSKFAETMGRYTAVLQDWSPAGIVEKYGNVDGRLLKDLLKARGLTAEQNEHQLASKSSQFPAYAEGLLAGARYFSRYRRASQFAEFVGKWLADPDMVAMLPQYFAALKFKGFGAALAADFLKEIGVKQLGKPDIWLCRCLEAAGWVAEGASAFDVQRVLSEAASHLGEHYPPVIIDKLMFLVGAGRYVMAEPQHKCKSRFEEFRACVGS